MTVEQTQQANELAEVVLQINDMQRSGCVMFNEFLHMSSMMMKDGIQLSKEDIKRVFQRTMYMDNLGNISSSALTKLVTVMGNDGPACAEFVKLIAPRLSSTEDGNLNVDELIEKLDFTFKVDIKSNKYIPKFSIEVKTMYIAKLGYLSTRCLSSKTGNIPRCNCSNRYAIQ